MRIDIISDVVCPWCFIGKRRLERALRMRPDLGATLTWRAFQLNPDMPEGGMDRQTYLAAKFGGNAHASRIYAAIADAGASEGIAFAFGRIRRTPNSQKAHRLVRLATAHGKADLLVEDLFSTYFLEGGDIGDPGVLAAMADRHALPADEGWFAGEGEREAVLAEDRAVRRMGINAVPCFIVDGRYAISGAQEPEFFLPLFDLVRNRGTELASTGD